MSKALYRSTFCYRIPFFLLPLIRSCPSLASRGVSMSLIWVFLLVFFIAPQVFAHSGHGTHRTLSATVVTGGIDVTLSGAQLGFELYGCSYPVGGTACTLTTLDATNRLSSWVDNSTNTFEHRSLNAGTVYLYKAIEYEGSGTHETNEASATTPNAPALTASSISVTAATLTLTNHSGNWYYKKTAPTTGSCSATQTSASVNLTNLTAGTSYTYKAYSDSACSMELASTTFTTGYDLNLRVTASGTSAITLSWTNLSTVTLGYDVYRCTVESQCAANPPPTGANAIYLSWVPKPGGDTITLVDDNDTESGGSPSPINPGTTYYYAVQGYIAGGSTGFSRVTATAGAPPTPALPVVVKVTGLKATAVSEDSISLSWKPSVKDVEKSYNVYRCTVPQGETTCDPYDGLWLAALRNSNAWTDTEVTPGETYRYAVAVEPFRREELSGAITVVAQMTQMLAAPTGLMVTEVDESSLRLRWTAPEDDGRGPVQSIDIYRCNVDRSPGCSEFLYLTSRNPALTEYKDNDAESDTTYRYAVAAYRSDDEVSPWSNQVTAATERGRYASPTELTVTATFANAISLSWSAPGEGILGYNVYRCSASGGGTNCEPMWHAWEANPGDAPPAPTSYTDTGGETGSVISGTIYRYEVAASFPPNYRNGDRSDEVTATAQGAPAPEPEQPMVAPPAPTDFTAVSSESGIDLSWTAPADDIAGYSVYRCEEGETPCTPEWLAWVANDGDTPPAPTGYSDSDATEGTTYRYAVTSNKTDSDGEYLESDWSDEVTATAEGEPAPEPEPETPFAAPLAPTGFTAVSSESGIDLSWTAPADDIAGYSIYRCEEGETPCTPEWNAWVANDGDTPPAPTGYSDSDATEGTTYRYAVTSNNVDSDGEYHESDWSDEVTVLAQGETEPTPEPEPETPLAAPTGFTAVSSESGIDLSWVAPADDIAGYSVYRCEEGETPCTPEWLAWVANDGDTPPAPTGYSDTDVTEGTTYRYAVTSNNIDSDGEYHESDWSDEVTATSQGAPAPEPEQPMVAPAAPTGFTAVSSESGIDLSWTAPADDIAGYSVYRCEEGETPCTPEWLAWVANDGDTPPAPTGYSDTDVTEGTTYRYAVTSNNIDSDGEYHESDWSDEVTATSQGATAPEPEQPMVAPAAPTGFTAVSSESGIDLSWVAPADDIAGYSVYRCEEGETPCTPEWLAWVANDGDTPPAPTGYSDTDVTEGTTYRYAVTSNNIDSDGEYHESDWSDEVTATSQGAPAPAPEQPMVAPAAPTGFTAVSSESGIDLSWTAPADDIAGYSVYRCEEGETPCTPEWLAWVANDGDTPPAPTGYSDSDVTEGTTYRYAVTSNNIDSDGEYHESDWSDEVTATAQGGTGPEPEPEVPEVTPADKQAALEDVSATVGRNMLSSVVSTIGNRFTAASDNSEFSLAGRQVTLDEVVDQMTNEIGWDSIDPGDGYAGLVSGSNLSTSDFGFDRVSPRNNNRTVSWRQLLGGSSFLMSFGASGENSRQWNLWGSGDIQSFDGDSHDGDIYTGYLGADLRIKQDLLTGVSVSHSVGEADYIIDDQEGKLDTELTTVLPYTRLLLNDRTEVWAILGAGWGEAEHTDGSVRETTDLSVALGAFGGRRMFGMDSGGMNWAVRADASFIRLWTDEGMQTVDDLAVNASQLRLGLEASHPFILENSAMVRPFADVGVRYDGGEGENTGAGIELASGLRYDNAASGFWLEARGRMLVLHSEDDDYEEQGFSLSAGLQPYSDGTGLSLLVSPRWGGSVEGTQAMLSPNVSRLYHRDMENQRRRGSLHTELSYGFATPKTGGVTTPFAEFDVTDGTGYRAKLGTRYHLLSGSSTLKLELSSDLTTMPVHGVSAFDSGTSPSHEVWLTAELQGLPTTSTDNRRRRAVRIMAQADNTESTAIDDKKVAEEVVEVVEIEEIRVTGSRFQRSLSDALDEKRRASEIIEALSAEDIGELPGTSVAESLAKLPGVSYTRNAFGANNVSVRGLGAGLTNGTLNNRDLASEWGDRSVSFNMFPAELISRASLYKAPSASHVEGGIGGTLNLQTARALEWGERYVAVNVRGRYNDLAGDLPDGEEFGYRGSIAYLDQFADDTLGIALGYAGQYAPLVGADSQIYESRTVGKGGAIDGIPDGFGDRNSFNIPYGSEYSIFNGTSDRHSVLGTIQWMPIENFEVNFDGFFSKFEQTNTGAGLRLAGGLGSSGNRWRNVETDGYNVVGATVTCLHELPNNCVDRSWGQDLGAFNALEDGNSELHSYGIEGKWTAGALTLVYDFSYSKADGEDSYTTVGYRPYNGLPGSLELVRPVSTFGENEDGAGFLTSPLDFTNLATNRVDAFRHIENEREDEIFTYKFDAEYAADYTFFTAFKAGVRLVNRDNLLARRDARLDPSPTDIDSSVAIDPDFVFDVYDQSEADSAFDANPVLVLDARAIRNTVFAGIEADEQASGGHFIEEDIKAYYVQADFETDTFFGIPASGNFGVRIVTTDVDTQGTTNVDGVEMPISTSDKYTEVLPSANINFFPTDDIIVRLAGARVLARPAITFLSPGTDKYGDEIYSGANGGGNPYLRPYIANQFDLSFERYFDRDTAIALAFFYKDMDTFITQARTESGPPDDRVTSFIAANGAGGRILGIEATVQHTFANLLPEGYGDVGVYTTYTWTDSNIELSETFNSSTFSLDGQSKHLGNVTLHYHRDKFGARASYRYRSEFTRPQRPARAFTINRSEGDLSFQVSYDFNKQLRLFVEGWGLLNEPRDNYHGLDSLQGQYTLFGRNIQLGASYRF